MNEIILFVVVTSTMTLAFNLFALESNDLLSLQLYTGIGVLIFLLPMNFSYCYFAEMVASDLCGIGDVFYDSAWYRLPVKLQKVLILPIQRTGQEIRFRSFGFIDCSLAMFLKVKIRFRRVFFSRVLFYCRYLLQIF